jgi:subtilisin family serine protease
MSVAVLDTGMDLNHPDFRRRPIRSRSFVANEAPQDGHGHGTHCIGTACGPLAPAILPRYGCAYGADIFAGKVLGNDGSGADRSVLAGINWAIANGCTVISLSLGAPTSLGERPSAVYEHVGQRALARGVLIVAAAGNESDRPGKINPVCRPANCRSIMAVGAIDSELRVASFSNGGLNGSGGAINIVAPGVDVYSSVPMRRRYARLNGTSIATPHVAGIAAMHAEATGVAGYGLWSSLMKSARRLDLPSSDAGCGLVQAP